MRCGDLFTRPGLLDRQRSEELNSPEAGERFPTPDTKVTSHARSAVWGVSVKELSPSAISGEGAGQLLGFPARLVRLVRKRTKTCMLIEIFHTEAGREEAEEMIWRFGLVFWAHITRIFAIVRVQVASMPADDSVCNSP